MTDWLDFYRQRLDRRKAADQALRHGWPSRQGQEVRFAQVIRSLQALSDRVDISAATVFDFGCGTGELFQRMDALGIGRHYIGVDGLQENISDARVRTTGLRARVDLYRFCWDGLAPLPFSDPIDISVENGAFATIPKAQRAVIFQSLLKITRRAFVGTFYDPAHPTIEASYGLFSITMPEVIDLIDREAFNYDITVGYVAEDFTLSLYRINEVTR